MLRAVDRSEKRSRLLIEAANRGLRTLLRELPIVDPKKTAELTLFDEGGINPRFPDQLGRARREGF